MSHYYLSSEKKRKINQVRRDMGHRGIRILYKRNGRIKRFELLDESTLELLKTKTRK